MTTLCSYQNLRCPHTQTQNSKKLQIFKYAAMSHKSYIEVTAHGSSREIVSVSKIQPITCYIVIGVSKDVAN